MNGSDSFLNKEATVKMPFQRLLYGFSAMSSIGQAGILGGAAVILLLIFSFLFRTKQPSKSNKSKGERAKEMKQAFQSIENRNRLSIGIADMKVGALVLDPLMVIS
jgi:hypothetical protein